MISYLKDLIRGLFAASFPTSPEPYQPQVQAAQDDFQRYLREVEERDRAARLLGMQRQAEQAERDAARWTGEPRC